MPKGPNVGYIRKEVKQELTKWGLVDDCVSGEEHIKGKGETYLPAPNTDTCKTRNKEHFESYKKRAVFFPVTRRTLEGLVGQVFNKEIQTDLPSDLETMAEDVDGAGTNLEQQSKQVLESVLKKGRAGLLADFPKIEEGQVVTQADINSGKIRPRVILYQPGQIINWREQTIGGETRLSLLVLKESKITKDDGFEFDSKPRWRVYRLIEGVATVTVWKLKDEDKPDTKEKPEYEVEQEETTLLGSGQTPLESIPFCFVGATNNDSTVDETPLYPIASLNIAHYRNSADYEQTAFITGQATPVFTGLTDDWVKTHIKGKVKLGSANAVALPPNATATLLQAQANSLPMEAMKHKEDQMKAIGAKLIEPNTVQRTATESEIEETSEASILSSIAKNVSAAYQKAFFFAATFFSPTEEDQILIELNSEFQVMGLNAQERTEVVSAWQAGLITKEEARDVYRRKGIATEADEQAFAKISEEGVVTFGDVEEIQ